MKRCSKCKTERELSEFHRNRSRRDGLSNQCKECRQKYHQAYWKSKAGREVLQKYRQSRAGKETQRKADQKRQLLHPERRKARSAVSHAIRDGRLIKPSRCEACSEEKQVQGHHKSYEKDKWLKVNWLCDECHRKWEAFFWEAGKQP